MHSTVPLPDQWLWLRSVCVSWICIATFLTTLPIGSLRNLSGSIKYVDRRLIIAGGLPHKAERDDYRAEDNDAAGEKHGTHPGPGGKQPECRAPDAQRHIE